MTKILKFPKKKVPLKITQIGEVTIRKDGTILLRGFILNQEANDIDSKILILGWAMDQITRVCPKQ